jgi:predicted ATP-grasp superfamily ATP-dependent carboligase
MTHLLLDALPELRDPALIVSFGGWTDMGEAATAAVRWLVRHLPGRRAGGFDPEPFHVFADTRPTVRYVDGQRQISWPAHDLFAAVNAERPRDLLLLVAREPELRWRTYCEHLIDLARRTHVTTAISLGAFLADAPHSRPVPVTGFATTSEWWSRLREQGATPSDYQGPTGIAGVLHDFCRTEDLASFSLWAAVPHYLPTTANPKAALALLRRLDALLGLNADLGRLEQAAAYFERQVNDAVARDRRAAGYLRELERRADQAGAAERVEPAGPLPSAEEVIRDLEDFLRGQSSGGDA